LTFCSRHIGAQEFTMMHDDNVLHLVTRLNTDKNLDVLNLSLFLDFNGKDEVAFGVLNR
jgi:hypothetical protein